MKHITRWIAGVMTAGILVMPMIAWADADLVYRYTQTFAKQFNPKWQVYLYQEFNFRDPHPSFYAQNNELGAVYSGLAKWFDLSVAYGRISVRNGDDWTPTNNPYVAGTLKGAFAHINLSNKMRMELNTVPKNSDDWRYRDAITLAPDIKWTKLELQPSVTDELFYDLQTHRLTRNELVFEVDFKVWKSLKAGIFYMLAKQDTGEADNHHFKQTPMLGSRLMFNF